jgi:hypothetical protein
MYTFIEIIIVISVAIDPQVLLIRGAQKTPPLAWTDERAAKSR